MIIDIHTHTFPDAIAHKTIAGMEEDIVRGQGIHVKSARYRFVCCLPCGN